MFAKNKITNRIWRHSALIVLIILSSSSYAQKVGSLPAKQWKELRMQEKEALTLDVRTAGEYQRGFIEGAGNLDVLSASFHSKINLLDKSKTIFVYCASGSRSLRAAQILQSAGFTNIYNLHGGIQSWLRAGYPTAQADNASSKNTAEAMSMSKYDELIKSNQKVLVEFKTTWCGPCRKMVPVMDAFSKNNPEIKVLELDADENKALVKALDVYGVPVLLYYEQGKLVWSNKGYISLEELQAKSAS